MEHALQQQRQEQPSEFVVVDILRSGPWLAAGADRLSTPLVQINGLRIAKVWMAAGAHWPSHSTAGRIAVQPLRGTIRFSANDQTAVLRVGQLLALSGGIPHSLEAVEESEFLLTISRCDVPRS